VNDVEKETAIEEIQKLNADAKVAIKRGEAYKRLLDNPDFIEIIREGYCKRYPEELALAVAGNTGAYDTEALIESLKGINGFNAYGFQIVNTAQAGEQALIVNQEYLDNLDMDEV